MPTNNLKQVFLPKSIGKNRTCEKTIIVCFIWSDGVHTVCVCVYELYIVLSHCAQVGSIAEAAHLTIYFLTGVVKVWMADAASICREIVSHKEFFQSGEGDSLNDSFEKVIVSMVKGLKALSAADASKIIDVLSNSPYGQKGTKTIRCAINAKVSSHNLQRSKSSVNGCDVNKQHIKNPLTIFTQKEVSILESQKVCESAKFTVIVERHAKKIKKNKENNNLQTNKAEPDWVHPSP